MRGKQKAKTLVASAIKPSSQTTSGRPLVSFPRYGGKARQLKRLLPLLPTDAEHYCEPFCGAASALLNRPPADLETLNDLDGELVNFFKVLRERPVELIGQLALTPFARQEFAHAVKRRTRLGDLERARRFFIAACQSYAATQRTATAGNWNFARAGSNNKCAAWPRRLEALTPIAERLRRVQLESRPAVQVIRQYDQAEALFYCDPPYLAATRSSGDGYVHELDEAGHVELAEALGACQARVAISGYPSRLYNALYRAPRWRVVRWKTHKPSSQGSGQAAPSIECVWMNFGSDGRRL